MYTLSSSISFSLRWLWENVNDTADDKVIQNINWIYQNVVLRNSSHQHLGDTIYYSSYMKAYVTTEQAALGCYKWGIHR